MGKHFTIYLAGRDYVQFEDDGVVIDVYAGAPPENTAVKPRATVRNDAGASPKDVAAPEAEDGSNIHIPVNIDPPFYAVRVERLEDPEAGSDDEQ